MGSEKINGVDAVKITGEIPADKINEALAASGSEFIMSDVGMDQARIDALAGEPDALPLMLYLDRKTDLPLHYEIDMAALLEKLMGNIMEGFGTDTLGVHAFTITISLSDFNGISEIVIPEEALSAAQ